MDRPPTVPIPAQPGCTIHLRIVYGDGSMDTDEVPVLAWLWYGDDHEPGAIIVANGRATSLRDYLFELREDFPGLRVEQDVRVPP